MEQNGSDRTVCTTRLSFLDTPFRKGGLPVFLLLWTTNSVSRLSTNSIQYQLRFNSGCKQRVHFLCLTKILRFWMIKMCYSAWTICDICVAFFLKQHLSKAPLLFCSSKNFFSLWSKLNRRKVLNPENARTHLTGAALGRVFVRGPLPGRRWGVKKSLGCKSSSRRFRLFAIRFSSLIFSPLFSFCEVHTHPALIRPLGLNWFLPFRQTVAWNVKKNILCHIVSPCVNIHYWRSWKFFLHVSREFFSQGGRKKHWKICVVSLGSMPSHSTMGRFQSGFAWTLEISL